VVTAAPNITSRDLGVGQLLEDQGEEAEGDGGLDEKVDDLPDERLVEGVAGQVFAHRADGGADEERDQEHEAHAQDHREREDVVAEEAPDAAVGLGRHLPDRVEGVLELAEDAGGAEEQGGEADHGGEDAGGRLVRGLQQPADHLGPVLAHHPADRVHHLAAGGVGAEHQPGDGDHDDQQGGQGEDGVVGQGGRESLRLILAPVLECLDHQVLHRRKA
jgi:hypothetical protein